VVRWDENNFATDGHVKLCWPAFVSKAREIYELFGVEHEISITDLIFITGTGLNYRFGFFKFEVTKGTNANPPHVELIEYSNSGLDEKWAEWVVDADPYHPDQIVTWLEQHPQYITFIQFERGES